MRKKSCRRHRLATERLEERSLFAILLSATFDAGSNGFSYLDDTFRGTRQPNYESGSWLSTGGFAGGGLQVNLGGLNNNSIKNMSGGWRTTFNVTNVNDPVTLSLRYNLTQTSQYEKDEKSQALVSVDGVLRGLAPNDYMAQVVGNGNGGAAITTGWQTFSVSLGKMSVGNHTLTIGGFNSKKDAADESTSVRIDDVVVSTTPSSNQSIQLVRSFQTWNAGIIPSTDPADITYHAPSGTLFITDSEIDELSVFNGNNVFQTNLSGTQLISQFVTGDAEPTGITYNEFNGSFYITNDDTHRLHRFNASLSAPVATRDVLLDVPSANDPEGVTSDPATGNLYVVDGSNGGLQVLVYNAALQFQYSFSIASVLRDGEGIAFHPVTHNLFIVSDPDNLIAEFTPTGTLVATYSLAGFSPSPQSPQGLAFGPTSNPNDSTSALALYISDGGIDNFPDGHIYETIINGGGATSNLPPVVNAGPDRSILVTNPVSLDGTVTDDGLPNPPALVTTTWSRASGPGTVTFGNASAIDTTATFSVEGTYVLRLTANDGAATSFDETTITVTAVGTQSLDVRVVASKDDAEEHADRTMALTSADLELVFDAGGNQTVGMRFAGVTIPAGATIQTAYVQFTTDAVTTTPTSLSIRGQASDNPVTFSTTVGNVSDRPMTSASALWTPAAWSILGEAGIDQRTPDLAAVIQEIVSRPGWASGNALALIVSGTGQRNAKSFDRSAAEAPLLHIEYSVGGAFASSTAKAVPLKAAAGLPLAVVNPRNVGAIDHVGPLASEIASVKKSDAQSAAKSKQFAPTLLLPVRRLLASLVDRVHDVAEPAHRPADQSAAAETRWQAKVDAALAEEDI